MRDLRSLIEAWGSGKVGAPGASSPPEPTGIYRDEAGKVWVRERPTGERMVWPSDVPEADLPLKSCGIGLQAWASLGWSATGALHWPAGTVAHIAGPRIAGLTMARWLARKLQERPDCSPVRLISARDLPAESWSASCGAERTLFVGDVVTMLGRPRMAQVGELLASRGKRSMVLIGDAPGAGVEWETINGWLRNDGARRVQL